MQQFFQTISSSTLHSSFAIVNYCDCIFQLHMRVHKEEKKYLCTLCGYKCKWATQLKYHVTKHTGISCILNLVALS